MTYKETIDYLEHAKTRGSVLGLERMEELCEKLDNPQNHSHFIHVGGTNGKGSVIAFIGSILSEAGYRVGRYVSPSVLQYEEIIQIQTKDTIEYISENELIEGIEKIQIAEQRLVDEGRSLPTLFEIETALAFLTFAKWNCDVVLLEVGLGGRLDATNIISNPIAVVMTPVSLDHTKVLGNTIAEIAKEKAGIIKENTVVITSEQSMEAMPVFEEVCAELHAKLIVAETRDVKLYLSDLEKTTFLFGGNSYCIHLLGMHQVKNAVQAIMSVKCLENISVSEEYIRLGLKKARWNGRFQVINKNPLTILDGAHNLEGARELRRCLEYYVSDREILGIMGVFADKDYEGICREVLPIMKRIIVVPAKGERTLSPDVLMTVAKKYATEVTKDKNVMEAYRKCVKNAGESDMIVVFGTLSFLSDVFADRQFFKSTV